MKWTRSLLACLLVAILAVAGLYALAEGKSGGLPVESAKTKNLHAIRNLTVGENAASVALNAEDDCTLFVALYEENGRMLDVCAKIISGGAEEQHIQVALSANGTEFFQAKAFLMDDRFCKPLCGSFSVSGPFRTKRRNVVARRSQGLAN